MTDYIQKVSVQLQDLVSSEPEMVGIATPILFLKTALMTLASLEMLGNYS